MKKVPVKLEQDLIVEAIFEIRFVSKGSSVSDLLPGLLYPRFKDRYSTPERLPISDIPREFQEVDPHLRYQPRLRLMGDRTAVLLGDRATIISCPKPYVGWSNFRPLILEVLGALNGTGLITAVERYSIKYMNIIPAASTEEQFKSIAFKVNLGPYTLTDTLTALRTEIKEDGLTNIIEVQSNASIKTRKKEVFQGLLLSVDTIAQGNDGFWDNCDGNIEKIHVKEKEIFFSLLTEETINKCGPVWQ